MTARASCLRPDRSLSPKISMRRVTSTSGRRRHEARVDGPADTGTQRPTRHSMRPSDDGTHVIFVSADKLVRRGPRQPAGRLRARRATRRRSSRPGRPTRTSWPVCIAQTASSRHCVHRASPATDAHLLLHPRIADQPRTRAATSISTTVPAAPSAGLDRAERRERPVARRALDAARVLEATARTSSSRRRVARAGGHRRVRPDIYERSGGTTTLVSTGPTDRPMSAGRALRRGARLRSDWRPQPPLAGDTNSYVYERYAGATTLISTVLAGHYYTLIGASPDGTRVFFNTYRSLVPEDTDARTCITVSDTMSADSLYRHLRTARRERRAAEPRLPPAMPCPTIESCHRRERVQCAP